MLLGYWSPIHRDKFSSRFFCSLFFWCWCCTDVVSWLPSSNERKVREEHDVGCSRPIRR